MNHRRNGVARRPQEVGDGGLCRVVARLSLVASAFSGVMLAGLLLVGCKVGPNYSEPSATLPLAWSGDDADRSASPADPRWWMQFNDPTLDRLIDEALNRNLTLEAAGTRVLQARAARGVAAGQFFPQVQRATGGVDANEVSAASPQGSGDRSFRTTRVALEAAWELDFWGKFRRAIESADAALLSTVADYRAVTVSLIAEVAAAYVQLRSFEERLALARANASLQRDTLDLTRVRFDAGRVSDFDVSVASALLQDTLALIPLLEDGRTQQRLILSVLLGRPPSDLSDLIVAEGRVPLPPPTIAAGVPADLLRRRPDVMSAERRAAAASAAIGVTQASLYPAVTILGSTGFAASDFSAGTFSPSLEDIFKSSSFQGFVGLDVTMPFLDYGRIQNQVRARDAAFQGAILGYQQTVIAAAAEVESGLSAFLKSGERAASLAEAVTAQQRAVEISLIQYRNGAIDFLSVNRTQTDLVSREEQQAIARVTQALGAIQAYRALGGGWEILENVEFVSPETIEQMRQRTNWGNLIDPEYERGSDLRFFPRPVAPRGAEPPDAGEVSG